MPLRHAHTATGVNDPTKQVSVNRWNEGHVVETDVLFPTASPDAPPAGQLSVFARSVAGRLMLAQREPTGMEAQLQASLGGTRVGLWSAQGNNTSNVTVVGLTPGTSIGTVTQRFMAVTNLLTRMARLGYVSAATPGSFAGLREIQSRMTTGAGGGLGGFFLRQRFGVSDAAAVPGARMFVGVGSANAPTNVEPDTLINSIGVAQLSTSDNLQMICAGASAQPAIDLGASFPANTLSADAYELALFAPADLGVVYWQVTRLNTGQVASGTFAANLPAASVFLALNSWRGNNAQSLAVGLDLATIYLEQQF